MTRSMLSAITMKPEVVRHVYERLLASHGHQDWWPADTPFEVMIGAVLTQNTAWINVERAIQRLRGRCALDAAALLALSEEDLADCIRPAGYFNVKARRLRAFCIAFDSGGGFERGSALPTPELRRTLLAINGVGPETADDILLYAFERPVFVVDAYTRRIFERLGLLAGAEPYETVRAAFEQALGPDTDLFNHYHALIVRHGKDVCRARRPDCAACCLRERCPVAA